MDQKLIIAAEESALHLKDSIVSHLKKRGTPYHDATGERAMSYVEAGSAVGKAVSSGEYGLGIVVCGSGMGVNLVANRYSGVYCGLVENINTARCARTITNCNVLAMGGNIVAHDLANKMVDAFLDAEFTDGVDPENAERLKTAFEKMAEMDRALHVRG